MIAYMYNAALYCEDCGSKICDEINAERKAQGKEPLDADTIDADDIDSNSFPVKMFAGAGESDTPSHCDNCGVWLENDLTTNGHEYVCDRVAEFLYTGNGNKECIQTWIDGYDIGLSDLMDRWNA